MVNFEMASKVLEIAITLTKADYTWIRAEERGDVFIDEPLLSTMKAVARVMLAEGIIDASGGGHRALLGSNVHRQAEPGED